MKRWNGWMSDVGEMTGLGVFCTLIVTVSNVGVAWAQWPQFGGPRGDFTADAKGLALQWPDDGPRKLWNRELGDGYATIVVDGDMVYTMYRVGNDEFAVALKASTGETVWEHKNPSPFTAEMAEFGPGPHTTPLVVGDRLFTVGTNAVLHCFDKKTGQVHWKHDLPVEFDAPIPGRGYGCSPIAYKNTVIVPVDRKREGAEGGPAGVKPESTTAAKNQMLVAFDQTTGSPLWKNQDFENGYASPILIKFAGEDQLVFFSAAEIVGLNPNNGELLWTHAHRTQYGANLSTPVWNGEDLLFCSAAYDSGSRVIRLTKKDGKTVPEEVWFGRKMRLHHGNPVRVGDHIYGSSGDFGPAFFMGVNMKTGDVAWRERGFSKATCVSGDGKLIILDEDGNLALTTVTPQGMTVHSKCKIAERYAWAAPTLVGKTLYVRDRKRIMALDLG